MHACPRGRNVRLIALGAALASSGAILFGRGVSLVAAGGSWYYVFAGAGLMAAGLSLATARIWVRGGYAVFLFIALQWAFAEVGSSPGLLEARMIVAVAAGAVLLLPVVGRDLRATPCGASCLIARAERANLWHEAAPAALAASVLLSVTVCGVGIGVG
ncbi:hypothetical protein PPMP20_29910 [Paraburkholderia phymatum]|uniref:Pyrrolo-quinoline quinone n=1 Tax=Paraburkholderia phymatum (strain DSM 17167 / CIP 108236 / LMG 21445 / STM815) TaxID=391038 RepID=B2JRZ3_PARP8|nr:hypothetical protein [Paraburkholderia phymatum]ACC73912.1 pyrrolo-quinoline quinone [Paraburkholderia phymatum STM815]